MKHSPRNSFFFSFSVFLLSYQVFITRIEFNTHFLVARFLRIIQVFKLCGSIRWLYSDDKGYHFCFVGYKRSTIHKHWQDPRKQQQEIWVPTNRINILLIASPTDRNLKRKIVVTTIELWIDQTVYFIILHLVTDT